MEALPPKQRWHLRLVLKSGAIFDTITESNKEDVEAATKLPVFKCQGVNAQGWPVYVTALPADISAWILTPHEVYLATRPNLGLT